MMIFSYTFLALSYTKDNFVRVQNEVVAFETRKWRILEQIIIRRPDLCALEEMDIFTCFLKDELPKYG
jgi:mRNA deadenylase 3'-5' endonuclease subunit Ccr4